MTLNLFFINEITHNYRGLVQIKKVSPRIYKI